MVDAPGLEGKQLERSSLLAFEFVLSSGSGVGFFFFLAQVSLAIMTVVGVQRVLKIARIPYHLPSFLAAAD